VSKKKSLQRRLMRKLRRPFSRAGIELVEKLPGHHYVPDYYGRAASKGIRITEIEPFRELAQAVIDSERSLLYFDRLYFLYQGLGNARSLEAKHCNIAEIGVYRGGTSLFLAKAAEAIGLESFSVFSFDSFEGHSEKDVEARVDAQLHKPGLFGDVDAEDVRKYLGGSEHIELFANRFQDACHHVDSLDFHLVHLDVDLFAPTRFALSFFANRLVPGAWIVVDDYGVSTCPGVVSAVEEFLAESPGFSYLHPMTEQCVLIKHADTGGGASS